MAEAKRKPAGKLTVKIEIPERDVARMTRLVNLLGDREAPFLASGLAEAGRIMADEIRSRAPGRVRSGVVVGRVTPRSRSAVVVSRHPASKELEFGRRRPRPVAPRAKKALWWPGAPHPITRPVKLGPFAARPFIGIASGGLAIGAARPRIAEVLADAIDREFARLGAPGGE